MMQNEQRLLQPSWIFRLGRVRSPAASSTGAERKSCCAKISPTQMLPWYGAAPDQFGDLCLVGISDDPFDAGHRGQFIRRALRVTARHQDAGRGIFAMHAAHRLANVFISGLGDGAGVQHHQVGATALRRRFQALAASSVSSAAPSA